MGTCEIPPEKHRFYPKNAVSFDKKSGTLEKLLREFCPKLTE